MTDAIRFEVQNGVGSVTLNRPETLNALSLDMIQACDRQLEEWENNADVNAVLIHAEGREFSSGADLKALYEALDKPDSDLTRVFYREEHLLARRLYNYEKPIISLVDGAIIGDSVALAIFNSHRVMTENASFLLPETGIGFFPAGGVTHFISRCPGNLGRYIGLSGAELNAADCLYAGLATHYIPSIKLKEVEENILAGGFSDNAFSEITRVVESFAEEASPAPLESYHSAVDECFGKESVEEIMSALAIKDGEWERQTLETLKKKSPSSLKVTLRLIRAGSRLSFDEALRLEYRVSQHFVGSHDYREGIRAALIEKDHNPQWKPDMPESVSTADVDAYFTELSEGELQFQAAA